MSHEERARFNGLTPILNVSDFAASMKYYTETQGFEKAWKWGNPPDFGCVARDSVGIFLTQGSQGQSGMWLSIFVTDVNALHDEIRAKGARIVKSPSDEPWGMREFRVEDPNGHTFRFGQSTPRSKDLKIKRTAVEARIEERLAAVLQDLARETSGSVGEVLEETLLHTFELLPGQEGRAVASPHATGTFQLIEALKKKHNLDYGTHDRFTED